MTNKTRCWQPKYILTPAIVKSLAEIEAAKAVVEYTPLPPAVENELRNRVRIRSCHFSTYIEGNRLTINEAVAVISGEKINFQGSERDVAEVRNYWNALLRIEEWAAKRVSLTEELICRIHALVEKGLRKKPTPYRDGQNAIRDSISGAIVYLPPEAKDVPFFMSEMIAWLKQANQDGLSVPIIAALIHYQLVTIHPFYDGNGRTARLMATFILHCGGYGLNGFFALEEHHAKDLRGYYRSLMVHPSHNYYMGRADADLISWVEYFIGTLACVFSEVKFEAISLSREGIPAEPEELRQLGSRARIVLSLFGNAESITTRAVANALGLSNRMARELIKGWVEDGWLILKSPSKKTRLYGLSAIYRQCIGNVSAI